MILLLIFSRLEFENMEKLTRRGPYIVSTYNEGKSPFLSYSTEQLNQTQNSNAAKPNLPTDSILNTGTNNTVSR